MRSIVLGFLVMAVTTAGCATVRNTPAQELAWERWQTCNHFSTIVLDRIEMDGRLVVIGHQHEAMPFTGCVQQTAADQDRRGAAVGPQELVLVRNFGCMGVAM